MHILIVNSSSFSMTLSNSLCKQFYIRSKLKGKRCLKCHLYITFSPFHLEYMCIRVEIQAGVLVYMPYFAVHIQEINMIPGVK